MNNSEDKPVASSTENSIIVYIIKFSKVFSFFFVAKNKLFYLFFNLNSNLKNMKKIKVKMLKRNLILKMKMKLKKNTNGESSQVVVRCSRMKSDFEER
jgi:hypothetical protein